MRDIMIVVTVVLILTLLYYIFVYNRLQHLINNSEEASSGIDIALNKRYDLISSLVEVVKGYSKHEIDVFTKVSLIRNNLNTDRETANTQMESTLNRLMAIVEDYPKLKASEQYLNLQKNLANVEEHLSASRRLYNRSVTELNDVIKQFPTNLIAKNHQIVSKKLFMIDKNIINKPKIDL